MNDKRKEKNQTLKRLNILGIGNKLLLVFIISVFVIGVGLIVMIAQDGIKQVFKQNWGLILLIVLIEFIIFWIGIIMVYLTSVQLGIKMRIIGIVCGMIPIAHLIALSAIIRITGKEARFEKKKLKLNKKRRDQQICKTKYPILMVHGVFFRDSKYLNYWGRIPKELSQNGATIYYGEHQSAAAVTDSAKELAARIRQIVEETGCEKVNVIAHSKGGLDIKTAVVTTDIAPCVASITTINTPHRGCEFADYLMGKAPQGLKNKVASVYNSTLKKLGDDNPDFIAAVTDLTASGCNEITKLTENYDYKNAGIYTQSIGSVMKEAASGAFPLNMSYHLVKHFDGRNDGLVGEDSFQWGEDYTFLENKYKRGISHGDMIDLNRENIDGFDVREFYVKLVERLKDKGL